MRSKAAEESCRKGLAALEVRGRETEAMALFQAACTLELRAQTGPKKAVSPLYRSYLGMSMALVKGKHREGREVCEKAARQEFFNAEVWVNLGRVEMEWGRKKQARAAFARALRLAPTKRIQRYLEILGMRQKPVLPFLRRSHRLNVFLGRLRHKHFRRPDGDDD